MFTSLSVNQSMNNKYRIFHLLLLAMVMIGTKMSAQPSPLTLMSWNIRYDNPNDKLNKWDLRKEAVVQIITDNDPDFIGLQEALPHQISFILNKLTRYASVGIGRELNGGGEHTAILYDTTKYRALKTGTFWLSPTPAKLSVGWDAALPRICTYGLFTNSTTKEKFLILNTHLDHLGEVARNNSAQLILDSVISLREQHQPDAVALLGDFNDNPDSKTIEVLAWYFGLPEVNQYDEVINWPGTFNGFDPDADIIDRIDFIFTKQLKVAEYRHIPTRKADGLYPSDHLPVFVKAGMEN